MKPDYAQIIEAARSAQPLPSTKNIGSLDAPPAPVEAAPRRLSPETKRVMAAVAEANPPTAQVQEEEPPLPVGDPELAAKAVRATLSALGREPTDAAVRQILQSIDVVPPETDDDRIRKTVEAGLTPLNFGALLAVGFVEQVVPVIKHDEKAISVRFRSSMDGDDEFLQRMIREVTKDAWAAETQAALQRHVLAIQVMAWNGQEWPSLRKAGEISPDAFRERLGLVRSLAMPVHQLLMKHLLWFNERVSRTLTMATLGNG